MSRAPALQYERAPCPWCGAKTEDEAGTMCKPKSDQTGEVSCAGDFDAAGFSIAPTAASLAALDAWIDRQDHN